MAVPAATIQFRLLYPQAANFVLYVKKRYKAVIFSASIKQYDTPDGQ